MASTQEEMTHLRFIDCNAWIGRRTGGQTIPAKFVGPDDLEAELDRVGVQEAVTYHALAREYHPDVGNRQLIQDVANHPRLYPAWVLLPSRTREMPPLDELVGQMDRHNVRYTVMFPSSTLAGHRFSLALWCIGDVLEALERRRTPLALDFTLFRRDEPPWESIREICENLPDLPIVLTEVQGRNNRTLYPLLERFENLHVQTAGFDVHGGLEDLVAQFGAGRLLYGSGYPVKTMTGARLQVARSGLSDIDKQKVASGNLLHLLGNVISRNPDVTQQA